MSEVEGGEDRYLAAPDPNAEAELDHLSAIELAAELGNDGFDGTYDCPKHGPGQVIVDEGSGTGFAGGRIYWSKLSCGCSDLDESGDVNAAY